MMWGMDDLADRIQRFETMVRADPENDMAHFSLGSAYLDAERFSAAAASLERCLELNAEMSRAMELAGKALLAAGEKDRGIAMLQRGYEAAASRGELRVQNAIGAVLEQEGQSLPEVAEAATPSSGDFVCRSTGQPGTRLSEAPLRGPIGQWIADNISSETWQAWIQQGTKVINELRLSFARDEDQQAYEDYMVEFLGIPDDVVAEERGTKEETTA
jgi:Fe-S cluster biosynthesis and repair protein YggX